MRCVRVFFLPKLRKTLTSNLIAAINDVGQRDFAVASTCASDTCRMWNLLHTLASEGLRRSRLELELPPVEPHVTLGITVDGNGYFAGTPCQPHFLFSVSSFEIVCVNLLEPQVFFKSLRMLQTLHGFLDQYFKCHYCRKHFLRQYEEASYGRDEAMRSYEERWNGQGKHQPNGLHFRHVLIRCSWYVIY